MLSSPNQNLPHLLQRGSTQFLQGLITWPEPSISIHARSTELQPQIYRTENEILEFHDTFRNECKNDVSTHRINIVDVHPREAKIWAELRTWHMSQQNYYKYRSTII